MQAINSISKRFFSHIPAQHVQWGIYAVCLLTLAGASYALWMVVSSKFYRKPNPASPPIRMLTPAPMPQPPPQPTIPMVNLERVLAPRINFGKLDKVVTETSSSIIPDIWRRVAHYLEPKDILSLSTVYKSLAGLRTDPYVQLLMIGFRQVEYFARQLVWDNRVPSAMGKNFGLKWPEVSRTPATVIDHKGIKVCELPHSSAVIKAQWVGSNEAIIFVAYADRTIRLWKRDATLLLEISYTGDIVDFWFEDDHKQIFVLVVSNANDPVPRRYSLDCLKNWVGRNLVRSDISKEFKQVIV